MKLQDEPTGTESTLLREKQFDESPVTAVVTAVAEVTGQSPLEMKPLCDAIDPDALNALLGRSLNGSSSLRITFEYCEQAVTITADHIQVTPSTSTER